jgi:hypothetical protein
MAIRNDIDMTIILTQHLARLGSNPVIELAATDESLDLPTGTTARLLAMAANHAGYEIQAMGLTHASLRPRQAKLIRA